MKIFLSLQFQSFEFQSFKTKIKILAALRREAEGQPEKDDDVTSLILDLHEGDADDDPDDLTDTADDAHEDAEGGREAEGGDGKIIKAIRYKAQSFF